MTSIQTIEYTSLPFEKQAVWPVPQSRALWSMCAHWEWIALVLPQLLGGSDFFVFGLWHLYRGQQVSGHFEEHDLEQNGLACTTVRNPLFKVCSLGVDSPGPSTTFGWLRFLLFGLLRYSLGIASKYRTGRGLLHNITMLTIRVYSATLCQKPLATPSTTWSRDHRVQYLGW
jgi:hypothetical protein